MKLADLRKLSIRKQLKIRFQLSNGLECVITEHGIAQVPALRRVPDFNLERELADVSQFVIEPARVDSKSPVKPKTVTVEELTGMLAPAMASAADHEED
jgi:hypothetical protein